MRTNLLGPDVKFENVCVPNVTNWSAWLSNRELPLFDDHLEGCHVNLRNVSRSVPINVGVGEDVTLLETLEVTELTSSNLECEDFIACSGCMADGARDEMVATCLMGEFGSRTPSALVDRARKTYARYMHIEGTEPQ